MLCIIRQETDPYFNIAAEEYVMKYFKEECFMLWRNEPSIIVGKHQNTLAEINLDYVTSKQIKVVRRLTGGGAVFHDFGNLNFTFIANTYSAHKVDFYKFTLPIIQVLQSLGVNAEFTGRNDLTIEGKKFSGNAEHVYGNRILHHGTLLFSSVMADISNALNVDPSKFIDKAVKSVRSRVTNISEHLTQELDVLQFRDLIMNHVMINTKGSKIYAFTPADVKAISKLSEEKYSTSEWNFGSAPKYTHRKILRTTGGHIEVALIVKNGIIQHAKFYGDYFHLKDPLEIERALEGASYDEIILRQYLAPFSLGEYFVNITENELINALLIP